jgi:hypothetical protein
VNGGSFAKYVVLPGPHYVELRGQRTDVGFFSSTVHRSGRMRSCFVADPGQSYYVRAELLDEAWTVEVVDRQDRDSVDLELCPPPAAGGRGTDSSAAVLANPPHPGSGFFVALGGDLGGDNIVSARMSSGDRESLDAGTGVTGAIGGSLTPLWLDNAVGLGIGSRIGVKYDSIDAENGSVNLTRYPFSLWIHSYLRVSKRWYFTIAGGGHKELSPGLSGDGVASDVEASFESPWGWLVDAGLVFAETWHMAIGFSLRYTNMRYTIAGHGLNASNLGLSLTFHVNP